MVLKAAGTMPAPTEQGSEKAKKNRQLEVFQECLHWTQNANKHIKNKT